VPAIDGDVRVAGRDRSLGVSYDHGRDPCVLAAVGPQASMYGGFYFSIANVS
jgi:hypothetical protein